MKTTKIDKARAQLIVSQPFFAAILLSMPIVESEDIQTMATDGESILFNSLWVDTLSVPEVLFTLAHEVLHCVFDHMGRRENKTPNRYNQAADYVINQILSDDNIGSMPKGGLLDRSLYDRGGKTTEGIYKLIPSENENKKSGDQGGALDQVHDSGTKQGTQKTDAAKQAQKSADMQVRVIAAKNVAKMQGMLSAGLARLVDEITASKTDWKKELRKFLNERAKNEYSYSRPKRRFLSQDLYLPSLTGEKLGKIAIAVDCSGSVDSALLAMFSAELQAIRDDLKPSEISVIYFDDKVSFTESFTDNNTAQKIELKAHGGGGTAFSPVIDHVNAMQDHPACLVFLTDLICNDFGDCPDYPVLWCVPMGVNKNFNKTPYGDILGVNEND